MAQGSTIEWTDATWNPSRGCSRVSPGCERCYAERQAHRFSGRGQPYEGLTRLDRKGSPVWTGDVRLVPEMLDAPLRWRKPRRVFVNSMSDLFHERLTNDEIAAVFGVMAACPGHTFQILSKRAHRMREWFRWIAERATGGMDPEVDVRGFASQALGCDLGFHRPTARWPLPNVWLGVSVEDQQRADERIPYLLATPAAVRWISYEPALGPVDFTRVDAFYVPPFKPSLSGEPKTYLDVLRGTGLRPSPLTGVSIDTYVDARIAWLVCGGESGPKARPMEAAWALDVRDQCVRAGVPFFFKQWGGRNKRRAGRRLEGRTWDEMPAKATETGG